MTLLISNIYLWSHISTNKSITSSFRNAVETESINKT